MSEAAVWTFAAATLHAVFCLYWGVAAVRDRRPSGFFAADRELGAWVFVLAGAGFLVGGWIFLGHPDLIARGGGLPAATVGLAPIAAAILGALMLTPQWMLGRRYGYVTQAEMLGGHYRSEVLRLIVIGIALVFAIPFSGMLLSAAGRVVASLTGGAIGPLPAIWLLSVIVFGYVTIGGLRAAAWTGALQALLLFAGLALVGGTALWTAGGIEALSERLLALRDAALDGAPRGVRAVPLLEISGAIQFTDGLGREPPRGGPWSAAMILGYGLALAGLVASPAFTALVLAARSPKGFAAQQTWAAAGVSGALLVTAPALAGLAPLALAGGEVPDLAAHPGPGGVVAAWGGFLAERWPWFSAIVAVAAIASAQGVAALCAAAASATVVRDFYRRYAEPDLDDAGQRRLARIGTGLIFLAAALLASFAPVVQARIGGLALSFGAQLIPAVCAMCWLRWVPRAAVLVGLVAGLLFALFTDELGLALARFVGIDLPWGRWPWTVHSAAWGLVFNIASGLVVASISVERADDRRRHAVHDFLDSYGPRMPSRHYLRPLAWTAGLAWLFLALGPGALTGNKLFAEGRPGQEVWMLGVPPLWAWHLLLWALGVAVVWFLCYRLRLAGRPVSTIEPTLEARKGVAAPPAEVTLDRRWFWTALAVAAAATLAHWVFA